MHSKKSLKILKGLQESINRRRTDNTMTTGSHYLYLIDSNKMNLGRQSQQKNQRNSYHPEIVITTHVLLRTNNKTYYVYKYITVCMYGNRFHPIRGFVFCFCNANRREYENKNVKSKTENGNTKTRNVIILRVRFRVFAYVFSLFPFLLCKIKIRKSEYLIHNVQNQNALYKPPCYPMLCVKILFACENTYIAASFH